MATKKNASELDTIKSKIVAAEKVLSSFNGNLKTLREKRSVAKQDLQQLKARLSALETAANFDKLKATLAAAGIENAADFSAFAEAAKRGGFTKKTAPAPSPAAAPAAPVSKPATSAPVPVATAK